MPDAAMFGHGPESDQIATTVVERFLARPHHGKGMIFDCSIYLQGQLDIDGLERAWQKTISGIHRLYWPLSGRGRNQVWRAAPFDPAKFKAQIIVENDRSKLIESVDVRKGVGCMMAMQSDPKTLPGESANRMLRFFFHHAACDGVGGARAVFQTFRRFHDPGKKNALSPSPQEKVRQPSSDSVGRTHFLVPDPRNVWATIRGHNASVIRHAVLQNKSADILDSIPAGLDSTIHQVNDLGSAILKLSDDHVRIRFTPDVSGQVRTRLREQKLPLNDFAVSIALLGLANVIQPHPRRFLSIMNPVELRAWADRRLTNNHIGFAFVRRRHENLKSMESTMASVYDQMSTVREHGISQELASGMAVLERIPTGLTLIEKLGFFVPTASLTCMTSLKFGKRFGFTRREKTASLRDTNSDSDYEYFLGESEVKDFEFLAPLQSRAQIAITMWDNGRSIALTIRAAPNAGNLMLARSLGRHWIDATNTYLQTPKFSHVR